MRTGRLVLAGWIGVCGASVARGAPPLDPDAAARALESPQWEERRAAESELVRLGEEALAAPDEEGRVRLAAWDAALARLQREGGPGMEETVARVLRQLEPRAADDQVRRVPRLLRFRVERLVAQLVVPREATGWSWMARGSESLDAWRVATLAMDGLRPEASSALLEILRTSREARRLAGSLAALGDEDVGTQAQVAELVAASWAADPAPWMGVAEFAAPGGVPPLATLATSLLLTGHVADLERLRALLDADATIDLPQVLRTRLRARGDGDLTLGDFVLRLERGAARASVESEAAARAAAADLPWLARLLARRALFVDARDARAATTLREANLALGLARTARVEAGEEPGEARDDPSAAAVDAALREGRLSQRLRRRIEAGQAPALGLAPVALGDGFVVYGTTRGRVTLEDLVEEVERGSESTRVTRLPRAMAVSNGTLAVVTGRGGVFFWGVARTGLRRGGVAAGPFTQVAAAPGGGFWFLGRGRTVWRCDATEEPRQVAVVGGADFAPTRLAGLAGGQVVLWGGGQVVLLDAAGTTSIPLASGDPDLLTAAALGDAVVLAEGNAFRVLGSDGAPRGAGRLPDGARIVGVAGDAAIGTVYLATADALYACRASDGAVRWVEQVEASGSPVVGGGFVAVSAGLGTEAGGDNRYDRTISVLRADTGSVDPFEEAARTRALAAALAAAREGRPDVAEALLDPLASWLSPAERSEAEGVIDDARTLPSPK